MINRNKFDPFGCKDLNVVFNAEAEDFVTRMAAGETTEAWS